MDRTIRRWDLLKSSHKSSAIEHGNSILELCITGNTPSKKNSKRVFRNRKTGRPIVMSSERHNKWHNDASDYIIDVYKELPKALPNKDYPCMVYYYFYRGSRHKFDYSNVIESINDLLVDLGIFSDDNADCLVPVPVGYELDKDNPRCEVMIEYSY